MGRHIPTPFHIFIQKNEELVDLKIEKILRIVPGRRLIGVSNWKDMPVIVKLFYNPNHFKRHQLRDIKGINLLQQSNVPTPDVLHLATTADRKGAVLIIDYLQEGESLTAKFERTSGKTERDDILRLAVEIIARTHRAGLIQQDIHLDNFMLSASRVYILDGGDIRETTEENETEVKLSNLATFLAQFPVTMDDGIPGILYHYEHQDAGPSLVDLVQFTAQVKLARHRRLAKFERKLFRSTTANRCQQSLTKFVLFDRHIDSPELEDFIKDPDSFISEEKLMKDGNSSTVAAVTIDRKEYVLKRYNIKNPIHGLKRLFQPSRAHHAWRNGAVLEMLGVDTPHPYLFMEKRILWFLRSKAYLLCEKVDSGNVIEQLEQESQGSIDPESLMNAFKDLFGVFNDYQICHGDNKATNFIYKNDRLYVLDLDAMQRYKSKRRFKAKFVKDLARFRKNWEGTKLEPLANQLVGDFNSEAG